MKHPAKFSASIIVAIDELLLERSFEGRILDPFAGVGGIHVFHDPRGRRWTTGVELEPEWAHEHVRTRVGNATRLPPSWTGAFSAVITSPPYGNRMADKDMRPSVAATYMKQLGRESSPGSMNHLQWGPAYQRLAMGFMLEAWRVLEDGGDFLLNVSNHVRKNTVIDVVGWYVDHVEAFGFEIDEVRCIPTPRMRNGANAKNRVPAEALIVARKP